MTMLAVTSPHGFAAWWTFAFGIAGPVASFAVAWAAFRVSRRVDTRARATAEAEGLEQAELVTVIDTGETGGLEDSLGGLAKGPLPFVWRKARVTNGSDDTIRQVEVVTYLDGRWAVEQGLAAALVLGESGGSSRKGRQGAAAKLAKGEGVDTVLGVVPVVTKGVHVGEWTLEAPSAAALTASVEWVDKAGRKWRRSSTKGSVPAMVGYRG